MGRGVQRDAHRGAQKQHTTPSPKGRAARRPPRAAPPCPSHPAAGGQCRYEEKDSIVSSANSHTPDLCYCAPSIEMQTSRVRRPQSARAPGAPQCSAAGGELGSDPPVLSDRGFERAPRLCRRARGHKCQLEGAAPRPFASLKPVLRGFTLSSGFKTTVS